LRARNSARNDQHSGRLPPRQPSPSTLFSGTISRVVPGCLSRVHRTFRATHLRARLGFRDPWAKNFETRSATANLRATPAGRISVFGRSFAFFGWRPLFPTAASADAPNSPCRTLWGSALLPEVARVLRLCGESPLASEILPCLSPWVSDRSLGTSRSLHHWVGASASLTTTIRASLAV
jgi:hypothetical protein